MYKLPSQTMRRDSMTENTIGEKKMQMTTFYSEQLAHGFRE